MIRTLLIQVSLITGFGGIACADLATVYLADGNAATVELVAVDRGQVQWKRNAAPNSPTESFFRSQIKYVDFPTTEQWRDAEEAFESGKFTEALRLYGRVLEDKENHFYPIPGNFVSLAHLRILECHRGNLNPAAVAKQSKVVKEESSNLPPEFRTLSPTIQAWIAVSEKKWDQVLEVLEGVALPGPESFFLKGIALENLGKPSEAIQEYSGAYVLNFGGSTKLTQEALQRSANLLVALKDENRMSELQAQAKIYRDLYGNGKLWSAAPEWLTKLADGEIVTMNAEVGGDFDPDAPPPAKAKGSSEGAVVVESAASAALPPLEERDWILVSELEKHIYVMGSGPDTSQPQLKGGVAKSDDGYLFDGTGGGIIMGGFSGNQKFTRVAIRFTPDTLDGVLYDLNQGKSAGFGLYLTAGNLNFYWNAVGRAKPVNCNLGKIAANETTDLFVTVFQNGRIVTRLNDVEANFQTAKNGLGVKTNVTVCIGDVVVNKDTASADGKSHPPFEGKIQHFSIGVGAGLVPIYESEKAHNGGKVIKFIPPPTAEPAPAPKPAPADPKAAPADPKAKPKPAPAPAK